eukprot:6523717-Alexandrium_andersonii.AAC.1
MRPRRRPNTAGAIAAAAAGSRWKFLGIAGSCWKHLEAVFALCPWPSAAARRVGEAAGRAPGDGRTADARTL